MNIHEFVAEAKVRLDLFAHEMTQPDSNYPTSKTPELADGIPEGAMDDFSRWLMEFDGWRQVDPDNPDAETSIDVNPIRVITVTRPVSVGIQNVALPEDLGPNESVFIRFI